MSSSADPRWDRLPHLFADELSADEAAALRAWIDESAERQVTAARLHEVWTLTGGAPRTWNAAAGLASVHRRVEGETGVVVGRVSGSAFTEQRRSHRWKVATGVAAAAAILVAGGLWLEEQVPNPPVAAATAAWTEYSTRRGQRLSLRLQDGTLATLAPGSRLWQSPVYGMTDRTLRLDGEASFVVTHDAARPFAVYTARAVARDLGTKFLVRAYANDPSTDVVVAEGVVAVGREAASRPTASSAPLSADSVVLRPGERARIDSTGHIAFADRVPLEGYFEWVDGRLTFHDTPLVEVARRLSRWHDVDVRIEDARARALRLTASFGDESIDDVIHRIAATLELDGVRHGRTFTLRARSHRR